LIEQGLTSAPTQYRLYGRRFLQVPRSQAILASCPDTFSHGVRFSSHGLKNISNSYTTAWLWRYLMTTNIAI